MLPHAAFAVSSSIVAFLEKKLVNKGRITQISPVDERLILFLIIINIISENSLTRFICVKVIRVITFSRLKFSMVVRQNIHLCVDMSANYGF